MKKTIYCVLFLGIFCNFIVAQSADSVTELLIAENIYLPQVSYFATVYLGLGADEISYSDATTILDENIGFPEIKNPQDELTYKDFSYFCTRVWNIKGGLMYRITKAPRYALRELKALGYVSPNIDPNTLVTGRDALTIMTECAEYAEVNDTLEIEVQQNSNIKDFDAANFNFRR